MAAARTRWLPDEGGGADRVCQPARRVTTTTKGVGWEGRAAPPPPPRNAIPPVTVPHQRDAPSHLRDGAGVGILGVGTDWMSGDTAGRGVAETRVSTVRCTVEMS